MYIHSIFTKVKADDQYSSQVLSWSKKGENKDLKNKKYIIKSLPYRGIAQISIGR